LPGDGLSLHARGADYSRGCRAEYPAPRMAVRADEKRPILRGRPAVCVWGDSPEAVAACLDRVARHTPPGTPVLAPKAAAREHVIGVDGRGIGVLNAMLAATGPADPVLVSEDARVTAGWLEALASAVGVETAAAAAAPLSSGQIGVTIPESDLDRVSERIALGSLRIRPRLLEVRPLCLYLRRSALELLGKLDETLPSPEAALEDLVQRFLRHGLQVIASDDAFVGGAEPSAPPAGLLDSRYAWYPPTTGEHRPSTGALPRALRTARRAVDGLTVTIDARTVGPLLSGAQLHVVELAAAVARSGAARVRVQLLETADPEALAMLRDIAGAELVKSADVPTGAARSQVVHRPQQLAVLEDVLAMRALGERLVVSQQDMIAYRDPAYHAMPDLWRQYRRVTRLALAAADAVVFSSRHSLEDALADDLIDPARAHVLGIGSDHRLAAGVIPQAPPELGTLPPAGFLLCIGNDFRHKNRPFALRLLSELRRRGWDGGLILAGAHVEHGSSRPEEDELLSERPDLQGAVRRLDHVTGDERAWLYENCAAVLYPTGYEGFGLVPFEAGRAGVPCLFAAQASLAELFPAEAASLVPWDASASAERVLPLLSDGDPRRRHLALLAEAVRQAPDWDEHAAALVEIYERAASAPAREASVVAWDALERERELERWTDLRAELGEEGFGLVRPGGHLPPDVQRAVLSIVTRPLLRRPFFGALRGFYKLSYRLRRGGRG
jgi:glycosyltransferase involved in cell wall biosynthesis